MNEERSIISEKERVEPNTMKRRMVLLWKLLYDQTDENHPVSTYDIVDYGRVQRAGYYRCTADH